MVQKFQNKIAKESKLVKKVRRAKTINVTTVSINARKYLEKFYTGSNKYEYLGGERKKGTYNSR